MQEIIDYLIYRESVNCFFSLTRILIGVAIATILGITLGILRSNLPVPIKRNWLIKFLFDAPKFPPPIAWIPFVILLFGIGELSAYTIVFIGAFAPIFTNAYEGAESTPEIIHNMARSMEIKGCRYLICVVFPASLPHIFTGIRIGIGMGWMSVIAAEMISGQSGLGYAIQMNRLNLQHFHMTIDMALIGIIGFFLHLIAVHLEKKLIPWHERTHRL